MAYDDLIAAAETSYGIPKGLYAKILNVGERSGPYAVSPKGAIGVAQLMPATAKELGVDPWDLKQNIGGGAKYFASLLKRYNGDAAKAIAAYNEGPGRVDRGIVYPETQAYLGRVMGMDGAASADIMGQVLPQYMPDPALVAKYQKKAIAAGDATAKAYDEQSKDANETAERIGKITDSMGGPAPKAPTGPVLDKPPTLEPHDPVQALGQFLPLLAAFGGALNKKYATGALSAAIGAMKAQASGDQDAMERAHQHWLDTNKKALDEYQIQRDEFLDALQEKRANTDEGRAQIEGLTAKYQMKAAQAALANGQMGVFNDIMNAGLFGPLKQLEPIVRQAQEDKYRQEDLKRRYAAMPPATQAYDAVIERGGTPEEAAAAAGKVAGAMHLSQAASIERGIRNDIEKSPLGKAYGQAEQYGQTIDDAERSLKAGKQLGAIEQQAILDAFQKIITGGNAIRGFQIKLATDHSGIADKVQAAMNQLAKGGPLSDRMIKDIIEVTKAYRDGLNQEYDAEVQRGEKRLEALGLPGEAGQPFGYDAPSEGRGGRPPNAPQDAKQAPDGQWYSPDPTRPGKFLRWDN